MHKLVRFVSMVLLITLLGSLLPPPAARAARPALPRAESASAAALPINAAPISPRPSDAGSTGSAPATGPALAPNLLPPPPSLEIVFEHASDSVYLSVLKPSGAVIGHGGAASDADGGAYTTTTIPSPFHVTDKVSWPAKKAPRGRYEATLVADSAEGRSTSPYSFAVYINGQLAKKVQGMIYHRPSVGDPFDGPKKLIIDTRLPADQAVGKCDCEKGASPQRHQGDPVGTFDLGFYYQTRDMQIASGGPPLVFGRTYSSMFVDTAKYPVSTLGPGWRHTYEKKLTLPNQVGGEPSTYILEGDTGNRLRFYHSTYTQGSGGFGVIVDVFEPARGVYATLSRDLANNRYVLSSRDQSVEFYDMSTGRLTEQRDAQGHRQVLTYYNTPGQPQHGQLQEVKDLATSRTLTFTYSQVTLANGQLAPVRLASVKNQLNQGVTFVYFAGDSFLTPVYQVLYNGVQRYQYTYTDGAGNLGNLIAIVRNGAADEISNQYVNGRVHQQIDAAGMLTTYGQVSSADYITTTITTSGASGTPIYDVTQHIYRADGTFEREIKDGQSQGVAATAEDSLALAHYTDPRGNTFQASSNQLGQPTDITDPLGGKIKIAYN
ncbi:MAG TPA: DUF6531 domain-containing protein, partial [Herpetosiphonaceae bacterium]|nr:DUF6531 domain-containing protein [Herpetosiphonaceae bacterium]